MVVKEVAMAGVLALAVLTPGVQTVVAADNAAAESDATQNPVQYGVAIVGRDVLQFRASSEEQAVAYDQLLNFAMEYPDDFGYPRAGAAADAFEMPVIGDKGASLIEEAQSERKLPANYAVTTVSAHASIARVTEIVDAATTLNAEGVVGADLIWKTEADHFNERAIVTVSSVSSSLFSTLAERYGDLVAVRIQDPGGKAETAGRNSDAPPFWGGAYWTSSTGKACTTGFSWTVGGVSAMLTAAHCISTGGRASYPAYANVGTVASGSEENWDNNNGTQFYTGQGTFRGDVALIRYSPTATAGKIYNGNAGTSTNTGVAQMTTRRRQVGDAVCINGVTTGGWCGATVSVVTDILYLGDGVNVWARHVNEADAAGWTCPTHGDSGAPVYVNRADGNVDAAGIFSGSLPLGFACSTYYTDIWDPYTALPGVIKHV